MIPSSCVRCGYLAFTEDERDHHDATHIIYTHAVTYESYEVFAARRELVWGEK